MLMWVSVECVCLCMFWFMVSGLLLLQSSEAFLRYRCLMGAGRTVL